MQRCRSYHLAINWFVDTITCIPLRLATNRLANIFGNDTIYRHDKQKIKNRKSPRNKPSAAEPEEIAKDFAKV